MVLYGCIVAYNIRLATLDKVVKGTNRGGVRRWVEGGIERPVATDFGEGVIRAECKEGTVWRRCPVLKGPGISEELAALGNEESVGRAVEVNVEEYVPHDVG